MTRPNAVVRLATQQLTALFGRKVAVREVSLFFPTNTVTAIIGPSGCGKSTFLRCLNRLHELSEGGWVTGKVLLDNEDIYGGRGDPGDVRRRVGMGFQRPTPLPPMSIADKVAAGLRVNGRRPQAHLAAAGERALRPAPRRVEELGKELKTRYPMGIVTHTLQRAARLWDSPAFLYMGELVEVGLTADLFTKPQREQTEAYITGRFG